MIRLGYIAPILLIALPLAACSKDEKRTVAFALKGIGIEDTVTVAEIEEAEAERPAAVAPVEPCLVVPVVLFRTHWCNPDTLVLEPIP